MTFSLHPNLNTKTFVIDLPLCRVLLEDNHYYPWLFLVPRRPNIIRTIDLKSSDQIQLLHETNQAQKILWNNFQPTQINVAAIGNKTPQLHVHIIARNSKDPAWPNTVWDHPSSTPYPVEKKNSVLKLLVKAFSV